MIRCKIWGDSTNFYGGKNIFHFVSTEKKHDPLSNVLNIFVVSDMFHQVCGDLVNSPQQYFLGGIRKCSRCVGVSFCWLFCLIFLF